MNVNIVFCFWPVFFHPHKSFQSQFFRRQFINRVKGSIWLVQQAYLLHLVFINPDDQVAAVGTVNSEVLFLFVFSIVDGLAISGNKNFLQLVVAEISRHIFSADLIEAK